MSSATLRERLSRIAPDNIVRAGVRVALAAAMLATAAGCDSHDSPAPGGTTQAGDLNLGAAKTLHLDANDDWDVIAPGVFTLTNGRLDGLDVASGHQLWSIPPSGEPIDKDKFRVLDSGRVLLVGHRNSPGLTAYDTATGAQIWSTPAEKWRADDHSSGQFVHSDARSGAQSWTVDPGSLGCSTPIAKDLDFARDPDGVGLVAAPGVVIFRCPATGGRFVIGGLNEATGAAIWHRDVPDQLSYLRSRTGSGRIATVASGDTLETIDAATGRSLGSRTGASDNAFRFPLSDGSAMVLNGEKLADAKEIRVEEPSGGTRWAAPINTGGEQVRPQLTSAGNTILATMTQSSDAKTWLVSYDAKTGKRTVVIGDGPTAAGEKPILTMALNELDLATYRASWGVVVVGPDNTYAVIPFA